MQFTGILAAKLHIWITDMSDTLTVLLVTRVHTVSVAVTVPAHGNAEGIQSALELICMAASRWAGSCRGRKGESMLIGAVLMTRAGHY